MSTPLGLSVGRLLQSLFPPLPNFIGRQVVAVHNSRDFIFFRRFRYEFALREDELSVERAKERGMDTLVRTRMQEIGPRLTLKLRWLKRGTLGQGRRRANGTAIASSSKAVDDAHANDLDDDEPNAEAFIEEEAAQQLEEIIPVLAEASLDVPPQVEEADQLGPNTSEPDNAQEDNMPARGKKRKAGIKIPRPQVPSLDLELNQQHRRKRPKPGASILDSINLQGGVKDSEKEWAWKAKMQVKKNRFFL